MKTLKHTDIVFKWVILGIFILHITSYFMPISGVSYRSEDDKLSYLYGESLAYVNLLIPFIAIVFLFANFKNSRLFFFGFSATYIFSCIFNLLNISNMISKGNEQIYYKYALEYGYYIYTVTMALLAVAIICSFIFYMILHSESTKQEEKQLCQSTQNSKIDILRKRIEFLDSLKNEGILTESEYDQKRSEIINELKI